MGKKDLTDIWDNPQAATLKRIAWAYGCAKKGSDLEERLLTLLLERCGQELRGN